MQIKVIQDIDDERIRDLLVTALEGGSNHWLRAAELVRGTSTERPWYAGTLSEGWEANLTTDEGDEYVLNEAIVQLGLQAMADQFPSSHWADFMEENEDADTADVFLQLAVLGEVTYG